MVQINKKKSQSTMNKVKSAAHVDHSGQDGKTKERYDFCAYATGLADATSHAQVLEALGDYGSVNTYFPRHSSDRNKSENFCYVFFKEKASMLKALETKHTINGAEVTMTESDKSAKKRTRDTKDESSQPRKRFAGSPAKTAYVGRLNPATLEDTVLNYFVKYGEIEGVVVLGKPGNSKGFAFVTFKNMSDLEKALNDKHRIDNRDVVFRRKNNPDVLVDKPKHTHDNKNEVLVHLNTSISQEDFTSYFQQIGDVKSVTFPFDKKSAKPKGRGYAFVSFETIDTYDKVLSTQHAINGVKILVKSANKNEQPKKQFNNEIMIKNLPKSCNRKLLKIAVSTFGNITNIALPHVVKGDMKSPIRGFAFIAFQTEESVKKALKAASIEKNDTDQKKDVEGEPMKVNEEDDDESEANSDEKNSADATVVKADEADSDEEEEADSDDEEEVEDESDDDQQEEDEEKGSSEDEEVIVPSKKVQMTKKAPATPKTERSNK